MDKGKRSIDSNMGKRAMSSDKAKRPVSPECPLEAIERINKEHYLKAKEEHGWNVFYYKLRKYTNRKNRKGKDWVPTEDEVEDEKYRFPEVKNLWNRKNDEIRKLGT